MAPVPSENARFDSLKQHPIDAVLSLIKLKSKQKPKSQSDPTKDSSCEETVESLLPVNCEYDVQLMKLLQSQSIYKSDIDSLYKSNDNFSRVLCAKNHLNTESPTKASGIKSLHNSAVKPIMNNSDMPMGDLNNMGLQKSNSEILGQETSLFIKEKSYPNDMEQLLKQLGPDMLPDCNSADGAGDIENVEEIFQAIKNFESNNTSEPMVCGDPGEIDNMVSETNDDNEVIFPMADSADIAGSLSNFFNDVDMMGICVDDNVADIQSGKDAKLKDTLNEMQKRQFHLQRKEEWLKRRMHKMQARQMTKQASEDVVSFLEFASNSSGETASLRPLLNCQNALTSDLKALRKKMPYANTSIFFRRLEQSLKQRHTVPTLKSSVKYFGSGRSSSVSKGVTVVTPKLSAEVRSELERVAGTSLAHLEAVQRALDSDATASSSGAESCDEMQNFNNQHQQHLPIAKRSLWKYVKERALIGSKWVWLQAQIADLQYKIREYDEFLSKVKATKKCVELKPESSASSSSVVINGYHGSLPGAVPGLNKDDDESASHCARTQPFCRSSFSNRKLGRVSDIFKVSKKPIKRSTVMCRCTSSLSCILCAGSADKPVLAPKQLPDSSLPERIAALDPGFHPILSFSSDVSLSTHLNSLMRVPEWQQGVSRMSIKSYSSRSVDSSSDSVNPEKRLKLAPSVEMFQHRKKLNTLKNSSIHGPGMKKKPGIRGRKPKILKENLGCHSVEKVKAKRVAVRSMDDEQILVSETGSDIHVSPPASPGHNQSASVAKAPDRNEFTRRKRENSYDIDNIVIPYSVAAMTRVEKLPYKEILTPKWRVIEEDYLTDAKNNDVKTPSQDSDCEDISDDAVALRHERCEKEERAKFRSYLIKPSGMSRPRHRRLDNPDSMDFESSSPMTTPPATPQPVIDNFCDQVTLRKRAPSVTKKEKEDVNSPIDCDEQVAPYEPREFPLTEETYKKMLEDNIEIARSIRYTPQYFPITNPDDGSEPSRNASSASSSSGSGDSLNMIPEDMNDPDWTSGLSARRKDKL